MSIYFRKMESSPPQTPFAPSWRYFLGDSWINGVDFNRLSKFILDKENEIINSYPPSDNKYSVDGYTGLGNKSLTSRFGSYNLLKFDTIDIRQLRKEISRIHKEFIDALGVVNSERIWIQCWANVLRDGEEIKPHLHGVNPYIYLGGHITVQCNDSSTVYINPINQINDPETISILNEVGKITLFQNNIPHYTTPHRGVKERISIAFDMVYDNQPISKSNMILLDLDEI
jgi:hypothetical protein